MPPSLPVPPSPWLEAANARLHQARVEPLAREHKVLAEWASAQGQLGRFGPSVVDHLGGPAWNAIHAFFHEHTGAGREARAPYLLTCFFYDEAFWPLHVGVIYGEVVVDSMSHLQEVPPTVHRLLERDPAGRSELDHHWIDCFDHLAGMNAVVEMGRLRGTLTGSHTYAFLQGADGMLASAAVTLLGGQPNPKAAEHARFAFESALKALLMERGGMTEKEVRKEIGHDLSLLLTPCRPLLDPVEHDRLDAARSYFPDVKARYNNAVLPREQLWSCYREARHAAVTVIRALGGEDSRECLAHGVPVTP